jgi:hypothetical protein
MSWRRFSGRKLGINSGGSGRQIARMLILAIALLASSCAGFQERKTVRQGLLALDLSQASFLDVWGKPTRTLAMTGDQVIKSGIGGWGGFFFKGTQMYEMWRYEDKQTNLIFFNQKLVAWQTSETVQQLATPFWFQKLQ